MAEKQADPDQGAGGAGADPGAGGAPDEAMTEFRKAVREEAKGAFAEWLEENRPASGTRHPDKPKSFIEQLFSL